MGPTNYLVTPKVPDEVELGCDNFNNGHLLLGHKGVRLLGHLILVFV